MAAKAASDLEPVVPRRWHERPVLPKPVIRIFESRQPAMRLHPGHFSCCGIILQPAVPGVPAPAGLKDRAWYEPSLLAELLNDGF